MLSMIKFFNSSVLLSYVDSRVRLAATMFMVGAIFIIIF